MTKITLILLTALILSGNAQASGNENVRTYGNPGLPEDMVTINLAQNCKGEIRSRRFYIRALSVLDSQVFAHVTAYDKAGTMKILQIHLDNASLAQRLGESLDKRLEVEITLKAKCERGLEQEIFAASEVLSAIVY